MGVPSLLRSGRAQGECQAERSRSLSSKTKKSPNKEHRFKNFEVQLNHKIQTNTSYQILFGTVPIVLNIPP
jgi:hypothetical protein